MTIAAAVVAGLFLLIAGEDSNKCVNAVSIISGSGFAIFIIGSSIYLTWILAQESDSLDGRLEFLQNSKKDFIKKVGIDIVDIDSYERYRQEKYKEEIASKPREVATSECYFVGICALFIISAILLLPMFISPTFNSCSVIFK